MIQEFVKAWDANKDTLRKYFQCHKMKEYDEYVKLVKLLFDWVINPYYEHQFKRFDTNKITVIDDGSYQGTQIFAIPLDTYQPSCYEYVFTHQYYGSCSGCDTLLGIQGYEEKENLPTEEQVSEHMTLCLHLLQRCKYLYTEEED